MNSEATVNFHGAEVNLAKEYHEARKLMGLVTTDHNQLLSSVAHIYLNIPESEPEWSDAYLALMEEMELRQMIVFNMEMKYAS